MKFIHAADPSAGVRDLSERIVASLRQGKKTLWLVCGGSNIVPAVEVMKRVKASVSPEELDNLTISQTDERYGPIGHADSNWKQMDDAGFDSTGARTIPVLRDLPFDQTIRVYGASISEAFDESEVVIGFFGIGPDGHIAGALPGSPAVDDLNPTAGYEAGKFKRLTITPAHLIKNITAAYAMAFGESKRKAISDLVNSDLSLNEEPAQLLKRLPEAYLYSDMH